MKIIREAYEGDAESIRDLFIEAYGDKYPFKEFYDTEWLKKAIFADETLVFVMEMDERIIASATMVMNKGELDDMIGEPGRLVATNDQRYRGKGLYTELIAELIKHTSDRVLFLIGEARTVHRAGQHILEDLSWVPVGFEPMKYCVEGRESMIVYAKTQGIAQQLRRNNPRVIGEVSVLAQTVLNSMNYPNDTIVVDEVDGYPTDETIKIEQLIDQHGVSSLLRIERGRVSSKEVFGNMSLSHGFFRIGEPRSNYLIARDGNKILGAVGFSIDVVDNRVCIFELIEFDDAVKGALLAEIDRIAREEIHADYIEVDVSAYSPKIQRTFERLGFMPVVYCPSMVFDKVERLDIIRMAKVCCPYDLGTVKLLESGKRIKDIVEKGFEDKLLGMEITEATKKTELFRNLSNGDMYHLARNAKLSQYAAGAQLIRKGEEPEILYILVNGESRVLQDGNIVTILHNGNIIGEMSLVDKTPHSADVVLSKDSTVIEIEIKHLEHILERYPRLGYAVAMNLARGLSRKLRQYSITAQD